jgi:hypothetical protein
MMCSSNFSVISIILPPRVHGCGTPFQSLISSSAVSQWAIISSLSCFSSLSCLSAESVISSISSRNWRRGALRSWAKVNDSLL